MRRLPKPPQSDRDYWKVVKVTTETGSVYEFNDTLTSVRRLEVGGESDALRRDGDWLDLQIAPHITVGQSMVLALEPLGEGDVTVRATSRVVAVST